MKLAALAGTLIIFGLAGILVCTMLRVPEDYEQETDYGILIDAGSTATRAHIYSWNHKTNDFIPYVSTFTDGGDPCTKKIHPGIASVSPSDVQDYLEPILTWAQDKIPKTSADTTPIFLMGTGGMRQLSLSDSDALLVSIREALTQSGFYFQDTFAEVLSGEQEAAYGFISVNALNDNFAQKTDPTKSFGSLDIGGVSAEIAFVSQGAPVLNHTFKTSINGTSFPIYVESRDGLGLNEARYAFNRSMILSNEGVGTIFNPCFPKGYSETVSIMVNGAPQEFILSGSSDAGQCWDLVVEFLHQAIEGKYPHPPLSSTTTFIASDKYIKIKEFYQLEVDATIADLEATAETFCSQTLAQALVHHSKYSDTIQNYCFYGLYSAALLQEFYGFDPTANSIIWPDKIKNDEVSWTLGAMIDYISSIAPDRAQRTSQSVRLFETDAGIVVVFISILVFVMGILIFIMQSRRPSGYTTI